MAKILVVDDELSFREVMHQAFEKKGHHVEAAINADHARQLMAKTNYDILILDVMMPGESGLDFLKKIRASQNRVPIVIYSVKVDAELEKEARQSGANEVLHKSVALDVLVDRTERILAASGKALQGPRKSEPKNLLIVDDEAPIRQLLSTFFKRKGYHVWEASSGEEAVDKVRSEKPTIMLLDMHLGTGWDGLTTLKKVMEIEPSLGVVMATGEGNDEMVLKAMSMGAYGYVLKPFDFLYLELVVASKLAIAEG
jgi:DNA-binding NtrC family response regulator